MIKTKRERFLDEMFGITAEIPEEFEDDEYFATYDTIEELSNGRGEDDDLEVEPGHDPEP